MEEDDGSSPTDESTSCSAPICHAMTMGTSVEVL